MPELPELSYQPDEEVRLEVRMEDETVWLTRRRWQSCFRQLLRTLQYTFEVFIKSTNWRNCQLVRIIYKFE